MKGIWKQGSGSQKESGRERSDRKTVMERSREGQGRMKGIWNGVWAFGKRLEERERPGRR